ncbi:MAG: peptidase [Mucilaginibacter sp.]|nr:peptidase [Mucilaginibacter sp.]
MVNAASATQISYTLTFPDAQAHYVDVEMHISGLKQPALNLKMPVWVPGSYLVREFSKNIETLNAYADGKILTTKKTRKNIWHINIQGIPAVTVKYRIYAFETSVRTSFIDVSHAFLSSPDIFIYPDGMLQEPSTIRIIPYKSWKKVSTSLENSAEDIFTLQSPNYDILFDSPIEVGNQDVFGFNVAGVKYEVAMVGGGTYDKERLKKDLSKIVEEETAIYGENPNKHYTFIVHNYLKGGGGLEHLSSTVLGVSRAAYATEPGYQNFLQLAAHEHFHLWNVKRLRPIVLGPFDYDNENYTTNLWIAEGFTAYYQNIIVRRMHLYDPENYLNILATDINTLENQPGSKVQPLADASFDAWIKSYRPNENSNNTTISYYNKGALIAMLLDLQIIHHTNGQKSMDDVMKYMYTEYYKNKNCGYTDEEFKQGLELVLGENLDEFYKNYIYGLTPIDYNKYLQYAGYKLTDELAGTNDPALGINTVTNNGKIIITTVLRESAAWKDGLNVNDEITAINGDEVTSLEGILNGKKPGDKLIFNINRDGLPMVIQVTLLKNARVKNKITALSNVTEQQLTVRKKWLRL